MGAKYVNVRREQGVYSGRAAQTRRLHRRGMSNIFPVMPSKSETIEVDDLDVKVTNPDKAFFPELGLSKMDLVRYYLSVGGPE
jgi:hypothetical protein